MPAYPVQNQTDVNPAHNKTTSDRNITEPKLTEVDSLAEISLEWTHIKEAG